ncbi:hypothetical protein [Flavobacterium longum]|uniref:hypothetical protein n=1 Tax=Flavobacterium longum TaxID=1299340 RepID=UPI0039E8D5CC
MLGDLLALVTCRCDCFALMARIFNPSLILFVTLRALVRLPAGPSFVWQQKKQKCLAPVCSATCSHLPANLPELAYVSDSGQIYAVFARQVPACANDGATKRNGFNIFSSLAQR